MGIDFYDRMFEEEQKEKKRFGQRKNEIENEIYEQRKRIEDLEQENAELKKEISVLLSCANCPENKGGYICEKEYNDKCLAQKIEYIKELKDEIIEREKEIEQLKAYESHWDEIEEDAKRIAEENTELKTKNNDLRVFSEKLSENHANEWQEQQQVITELKRDKEYLNKVNNEQTGVILKLNEQIEKMKCCGNCSKNKLFIEDGKLKCEGNVVTSLSSDIKITVCDKWGFAE